MSAITSSHFEPNPGNIWSRETMASDKAVRQTDEARFAERDAMGLVSFDERCRHAGMPPYQVIACQRAIGNRVKRDRVRTALLTSLPSDLRETVDRFVDSYLGDLSRVAFRSAAE